MTENNIENEPEIIQELGNMFLVRVDGTTQQVASTPKNELLYKHGLYSLLHAGADAERVVLSDEDDDVYAAVAPTANDSVYNIWFGDPDDHPLQNPPSKANEVLAGVRDALEDPADYSTLKDAYEWVRDNQVRRDIMEKLLPLFPRASVIPNEEGWVVEGMFLVTWDARVFIAGSDLDEGSYRVAGGVTKTDEKREFLSLTPEKDPEETIENGDNIVVIGGEEYELGELELMFLAKVKWLLHYDENLDDEAFWAVIKRHIRHGR